MFPLILMFEGFDIKFLYITIEKYLVTDHTPIVFSG